MTADKQRRPVVLTIAGFDPSGGAGVIADVRTIESLGCTAVAVITSVTFQNAEKFMGASHQPAEAVRAQVESILGASAIAAVKIGMLPTAEIVSEVARLIQENNLPAPVIDPVMESTSGGKLMDDDAFEVFVTELLPLARVVTPNILEAESLAGIKIESEEGMRQAAARIRELGARAVLVKGGHLGDRGTSSTKRGPRASISRGVLEREGSLTDEHGAVDFLDDAGRVSVFRSEWINTPNVRGTGCMLSSAIAASLAKGSNLEEAVVQARAFVADRIRTANSQLTTAH